MHTQALLAELLIAKPADPKLWLIGQLEKVKVAGTKPLLDATDLSTMFGMFDVTKRGVVTEQQASSALRTLLGEGRAPRPHPDAATTAMAQQEFVAHMQSALQKAAPLFKGGSSSSSDHDFGSAD